LLRCRSSRFLKALNQSQPLVQDFPNAPFIGIGVLVSNSGHGNLAGHLKKPRSIEELFFARSPACSENALPKNVVN
jgi:hypothetical protein